MKSSTWSWRRLSLILLVLGLVISGISLAARGILLESFKDLERQSMERNLERARQSIQEQLRQLDTITGDYSGWDDALKFVTVGSPEFAEANLDVSIYPKLRLNLLGYFDRQGRPVRLVAFDYRHEREVPLPQSLQALLAPGSRLLQHPDEKSFLQGVATLPEGVLLLASRPVLTSDYHGPVGGTLVMGRFLDAELLAELERTTRLKLSLQPLSVADLSPEWQRARESLATGAPTYIESVGEELLAGYFVCQDVSGRDAFLLRVELPRSIYQQGKATINYFLLWCLAIGVGASVAIQVLTGRLAVLRRRGSDSERRFRAVVEMAAEGIVLLDVESSTILEVNGAFAEFLGYSREVLVGRPFPELLRPAPEEVRLELERVALERRELEFRHRDGATRFAEVAASRIPYREQTALSLLVHDVTERRRFEEQLRHQANHDALTGLPNRNLFNDRMEQGLAQARRANGRLGLLLLDLDHFKRVNDGFGHAAGDSLLVEFSRRLQQQVRASDTLARLGGDEFALVATGPRRVEDLIGLAENVLTSLEPPFQVQGQELFVSVSMGIAQFPDDGATPEELFRQADTALHHAKSSGRGQFQFFAPEMNRLLAERLAIESQLRYAIERNELSLCFQPKFNIASGRLTGAEALLRWNNPSLGQVPPGRFIPVAEDTGLIVPIGEWALRTACVQLRQWQKAARPQIYLAVNLSARQFTQADLVERVAAVIRQTGVDPHYLELELTESLMMKDVEMSIARMEQLRGLGLKLSIDDFGTGYSSLSYVGRFPIDRMKVDKSFVDDLLESSSKQAIIRMIVVMAHSLGLVVTAEGVETADQLDFLRGEGCEEVQGYLLGRPVPAAEFVERFFPFAVAGADRGQLVV